MLQNYSEKSHWHREKLDPSPNVNPRVLISALLQITIETEDTTDKLSAPTVPNWHRSLSPIPHSSEDDSQLFRSFKAKTQSTTTFRSNGQEKNPSNENQSSSAKQSRCNPRSEHCREIWKDRKAANSKIERWSFSIGFWRISEPRWRREVRLEIWMSGSFAGGFTCFYYNYFDFSFAFLTLKINQISQSTLYKCYSNV